MGKAKLQSSEDEGNIVRSDLRRRRLFNFFPPSCSWSSTSRNWMGFVFPRLLSGLSTERYLLCRFCGNRNWLWSDCGLFFYFSTVDSFENVQAVPVELPTAGRGAENRPDDGVLCQPLLHAESVHLYQRRWGLWFVAAFSFFFCFKTLLTMDTKMVKFLHCVLNLDTTLNTISLFSCAVHSSPENTFEKHTDFNICVFIPRIPF